VCARNEEHDESGGVCDEFKGRGRDETERECEITCRHLTAQFDIDITEVFL